MSETPIIEDNIGDAGTRLVMLLVTRACNCSCKYCYEQHKDASRMSPDTAKRILQEELSRAERLQQELSVDFMGGEPLLNFPLIREVCEWLWEQPNAKNCKTFARTNGLLLNDEIKQWCRENKQRFSLGLSLDGIPEMNRLNRDEKYADTSFFLNLWPSQPIKMTLFPASIHLLAESVIRFHERRIPMSVSLGDGFPWTGRSQEIIREQLQKLLVYYTEHPDVPPVEPLLDTSFLGCTSTQESEPPYLNLCGENTGIVTYDCDGKAYRCHMFSPIVLGEERARTARTQFSQTTCVPMDPKCGACIARAICKQCFGLNYRDFNDLTHSATRHYSCGLRQFLYTCQARLFAERLNKRVAQGYSPSIEELRDAKKALYVISHFSANA